MKIAIIGTGYVGLVTGTCFAETGNTVTCVDIDQQKVEKLKAGQITIYEPGLEKLFLRNQKEGRLHFTTSLKDAVNSAKVIFLALPTPPGEDGSADLQYVIQVADAIGRYMNGYLIVVTKSTVPVGTAGKVKAAITGALKKRNADIPFDVASNPEFLKEGAAVDDFLKPDRIVIGVESEKAKNILHHLYEPFVINGHPIMFMDVPSAEMTKYAANAMLATKISFMNDIANLCEKVGADVNHVRQGIGSDTRIGKRFIYSGIGYGGSCFPKDVKALIRTAKEYGHDLRILQSVEDVNEDQKKVILSKINNYFNGDIKGKKFALWGLSFKPNTDDMREAPSLVIIEALLAAGAEVSAYDPISIKEARHMLKGSDVDFQDDAMQVLDGADALVLITEWAEFRLPDWDEVKQRMTGRVIFDGRNVYHANDIENMGLAYYGIGTGRF